MPAPPAPPAPQLSLRLGVNFVTASARPKQPVAQSRAQPAVQALQTYLFKVSVLVSHCITMCFTLHMALTRHHITPAPATSAADFPILNEGTDANRTSTLG